jgi:mono/diheme cytochrome c family protein
VKILSANMRTSSQRNLLVRKTIFGALVAVICALLVVVLWPQGDWNVPENAKQTQNPLQASPELLEQARQIYGKQCTECHGNSGKGDGPQATMYQPRPASFTDAQRMDGVTDGELFYKVTRGRRPMPSYKKRLTDEQRWALVLLIRSFANR